MKFSQKSLLNNQYQLRKIQMYCFIYLLAYCGLIIKTLEYTQRLNLTFCITKADEQQSIKECEQNSDQKCSWNQLLTLRWRITVLRAYWFLRFFPYLDLHAYWNSNNLPTHTIVEYHILLFLIYFQRFLHLFLLQLLQ